MSSPVRINLIYAGGSIEDGYMQASDTATAIRGMADMVSRSSKVLYGPEAKIATGIEPGFVRGSFQIHFLFDVLQALDIDTLNTTLLVLFGAGHRGLVDLVRRALPRRPRASAEVPADNPALERLLEDKQTRDAADRLVRPVRRQGGAEHLRVEHPGTLPMFPPNEIRQEDFDWFAHERVSPPQRHVTQELLRIIRPSFRPNTMWRFQDETRGHSFSAQMGDRAFMANVLKRRVVFAEGDELAVTLETTIAIRGTRVVTKRRVLRVHSHNSSRR